jgi:thioesterase domain-containing protein
MLLPIRSEGSRPPLFVVHGRHGTANIAKPMAEALGADQPLYVLYPRGIGGKLAPRATVEEMAADYEAEIRSAWPSGPYFVAGICSGAYAALEVGRALMERGEPIAPVLLIDPPGVPYRDDPRPPVDLAQQPRAAEQLYAQIRKWLEDAGRRNDPQPFDYRDPLQLHIATVVGVETCVAFDRHRQAPFAGPTEIIMASESAATHFHPGLPWRTILLGPSTVHVLPGRHLDVFVIHQREVFRLVGLYLDKASAFQPRSERRSA